MHVVADVMTPKPSCCQPDTPLEEVARLMATRNVGQIPVVDDHGGPIGVVTDRDITTRLLAHGASPLGQPASSAMSSPVYTVSQSQSVDECLRLMQDKQVRRVPVVDGNGVVVGMVSQADIARHAAPKATADLVREVSRPEH